MKRVVAILGLVCFVWLATILILPPHTHSLDTPRLRHHPPTNTSPSEDIEEFNCSHCNHLIIVPGHAIVRPLMLGQAAEEDAAWYLEPYQVQCFCQTVSSNYTDCSINSSVKGCLESCCPTYERVFARLLRTPHPFSCSLVDRLASKLDPWERANPTSRCPQSSDRTT